MYIVTKRIEIAGAHKLNLSYPSPCSRLHGHNWIIHVEVSSEELNGEGMVIDFTHISRVVKELDHKNLNDEFDFNPTAEHIADVLAHRLKSLILNLYHKGEAHLSTHVSKVTVQESEGNVACYIP